MRRYRSAAHLPLLEAHKRPEHLEPALNELDGSPEKTFRRVARHFRGRIQPFRLRKKLAKDLTFLRVEFARQTQASKAMAATYARYLHGEATRREMLEANAQLRELLKLLGLGLLASLPFGMVTLPAIIKLAEHFNIQLLPGKHAADHETGPLEV